MATKGDDRQWIHRGTELPRITGATDSEGDNIIDAIDSELTPPLELKETGTPDLVLNIGNIVVSNPETSLTRTIPPIVGLLPTFASGTVTFPAASGGNAVPSSGNNIVITVASGNFLKVGIYLEGDGDIFLLAGTEGASETAATQPAAVDDTFFIGYVVLENVGGTIQNITNARIYQFIGGGGGGGGTANILETNDDSTEVGSITITTGKRRWESEFDILVGDTWTIASGAKLLVDTSLIITGSLTVTGTCRIF